MDVMNEYNLAKQYKCTCYDISQLSSKSSCKQQQHTSASAATSSSNINSNLPNYPKQLLGNYNALMHLLNCNRDSPAVDAATSTASSASVAIIAAVASAASSAAAIADATRHLHVLPKLADSLAKAYWQTVHVTGRARNI